VFTVYLNYIQCCTFGKPEESLLTTTRSAGSA
jgi:hypothetical protein